MEFKEAMSQACKELSLDGHIKIIEYKKDAHTLAEKIAISCGARPLEVKK